MKRILTLIVMILLLSAWSKSQDIQEDQELTFHDFLVVKICIAVDGYVEIAKEVDNDWETGRVISTIITTPSFYDFEFLKMQLMNEILNKSDVTIVDPWSRNMTFLDGKTYPYFSIGFLIETFNSYWAITYHPDVQMLTLLEFNEGI